MSCRLSVSRAGLSQNCPLMVMPFCSRSCTRDKTAEGIGSLVGRRRFKQGRERAQNAIAIRLSQEALLGGKENAKRWAKAKASAAGNGSYKARKEAVLRVSCTRGILPAWEYAPANSSKNKADAPLVRGGCNCARRFPVSGSMAAHKQQDPCLQQEPCLVSA